MSWFVIHTKPNEEKKALANLINQEFTCYMPMYSKEIINQNKIKIIPSPLFSRYLFIEVNNESIQKNIGLIRSTLGVHQLLKIGENPIKISSEIIMELKDYSPYENMRLATSRCLKASGNYRTWIEWAEIYRDFYHPSIFEKPWNRSSIRSKLMTGLPKRSCQKKPYRPTKEITALEEQSFCSWAADSILNESFSLVSFISQLL